MPLVAKKLKTNASPEYFGVAVLQMSLPEMVKFIFFISHSLYNEKMINGIMNTPNDIQPSNKPIIFAG